MRVKRRKITFTTRYVLFFGILLFVASAVLGVVTLSQSRNSMRTLITKDMLDVVDAAAASLNGDVLGALTEDDVDGPEFREIENRLLVFQNSVDIEFIYAVKQVDEDTYVFTVDPDPVDPGAFGEEVLTTPALVSAAQGTPAVDESAAADRWGNFYSAYSPVFDSSGNVAGMVGIDFNAEWFDNQMREHTISIACTITITVVLGGLVVALITRRVQSRFQELDAGLSKLSDNVDELMAEMVTYSGFDVPEAKAIAITPDKDTEDELELLGHKIRTMQSEMSLYLDYLHTQAYTDSLTRVGNSTAYHETMATLNEQIAAGNADFWVAVFDMNSLKELNDTHGHEYGDEYIKGAAHALSIGFESARVFRIGGDEFAVVLPGATQDEVDAGLARTSAEIEAFNSVEEHPATLSVSWGTSCFVPGTDTSFNDVFSRADKTMYDNKRAYYREMGIAGRE